MIHITCQASYSINGLTSFSLSGNNKFVNSLRYINYKQPDNAGNSLDFEVRLGPFKPDLANCYILDDRYYIKYDYIYCKDKYLSLSWEIEITNFEKDRPIIIRINLEHEAIFGRIAYPIISGLIVDSMIYYSLISRGFAPVHASCASKDNQAYIFAGRSGAGKTTIILQLIKNGYSYVNDDIVILCPGNVAFGFVKSLNLLSHNIDAQFYDNLKISDKAKIKFNSILHKLSNGSLKIFTHVNPADTFHDNIDKRELDVKSIFLLLPKIGLDRINGSEASKEEVISNIYYNQSLEMYYIYKYFLAYSYIYPGASIVNLFDKYKDNLDKNLISNRYYTIEMPTRHNSEIFKELFSLVPGP